MATDIQPIRVLIIEDHLLMRAGLRLLIESAPHMLVVGEAGNRADALALASQERPDVVLLDIVLGTENGLDLLTPLLFACENARVIVITGSTDAADHHRAVALGAMGVVFKDQTSEVLIKAIERVHAGEVWLERSMIARVLHDLSPNNTKKTDPDADKAALLTESERKLVALLCEGLTNKQLAERLFISESTVQNHLTSIFAKLAVSNRLSLVIYAFRAGLADVGNS